MPYLHLSVTNALSAEENHALCEAIGPIMPLLPTKSRENTMMHIEDGCSMELGRGGEPCLFLEVRLYKKAPEENKDAFVKAISELLEAKLGVKQARMYINLLELDAWGSNGVIRR